MEVHWNTHREWWRGVLVFRYRSKVCKKLKAITPFCFAVRHEIPMTSHERSTFRERLSEPTTVQPLGGLVVVGGGCFVASRFDGLLLIYYLEKSSHRATISREPLWLRPSGRAMKPITVHFRHFSIPPRPARFRRFLEAALGPGRWSGASAASASWPFDARTTRRGGQSTVPERSRAQASSWTKRGGQPRSIH